MAKNKKKKSGKTSKILIFIICIMIILYTIATFALQYFTAVEVSPTLTTAWFAFWATELIALASIKNNKIKKEKDNEEKKDNEET